MTIQPWSPGEVVSLGTPGASITIIDGTTFCIADREGDIRPGGASGLFAQDCRFLSRSELAVNGVRCESLGVSYEDPCEVVHVLRVSPKVLPPESNVLIFRRRTLGNRYAETLLFRHYGNERVSLQISFALHADFADLFEVKAGSSAAEPTPQVVLTGTGAVFSADRANQHLRTEVVFNCDCDYESGRFTLQRSLGAHEQCEVGFDVIAILNGVGHAELDITPVTRVLRSFTAWRRTLPVVDTNHEAFRHGIERSQEDLGSLRMFHLTGATRPVVAAGAPWFMALFGRDSLIASWMSLMTDPELALGTLEALAAHQGKEVNPVTEEQPGRILHELRASGLVAQALGESTPYFGSSDATPLFVMLLGEVRRWGLADELVATLLPHADRALDWIRDYGDLDGDGYVEYELKREHGLENQGWKEAAGAICFADGEPAEGPIATAEIQGNVYAAYLARMYFAKESGDAELAAEYANRAENLRRRFNEDFWLPDRGYFAMALDGEKRKVDGLASNMGHCLWTGIVDEEKAGAVASRLIGDDLYTGWGVRTLARSQPNYDPLGYHTGTVWPHDSMIVAAGLMRYGYVREAQKIIMGIIDASEFDGGRLPELMSGISREEIAMPVPYPTSCSPQAWSAAALLYAVRLLLRFDPSVPNGKVYLSPELPPSIRRMRIEQIPLYGRRLTVSYSSGETRVDGDRDGLEFEFRPRRAMSGVSDDDE